MTQKNSDNHFDVLIVGAGISGIGSAHHLKEQCPDKTFCVLEGMDSFGGTWLMHKYPGIRSDSDMYSFGYRFKPWTGKPVASGAAILNYLNEVIQDSQLEQHIRYSHKILSANWCNQEKLWTLTAINKATDKEVRFTSNFLWMCQGYYKHSEGYTPEWPDMDKYQGTIVHPQTWPEDLDYQGKKVVIIGSGATAATLAPKLAEDCKHVTVLQRSPTYFLPRDNENLLANQLRELQVDDSIIHDIVRRSVLKDQRDIVSLSEKEPELVKQELLNGVKSILGEDYDIEKHFTPKYRPWRQRIAVVPGGDLFHGIKAGKASMVTDEIEAFTEKGLQLKSGENLEADIIVTATGFNLCVLGDIKFSVDGEAKDFSKALSYRGIMYTGLPNMAWVMGYFRAAWTLRVDLIGDFVCRLLNHMERKNAKVVTPVVPEEDRDMELLPWSDPKDFNPSYLTRSMHLLPKRGEKPEWQLTQDFWSEREQLPKVDLDDVAFKYEYE